MRRPLNEPWKYPATLTAWFGGASLIPLLAPLMVLLALAAAAVSALLCARHPEKYGGKTRIWAGLALCLVGASLFVAESTLFFRWKMRQAYEQRVVVSRMRLTEVARTLEWYGRRRGAFPDVKTASGLQRLVRVDPDRNPPTEDAFGGPISIRRVPGGYLVESRPPPFPGSSTPPPPLVERIHTGRPPDHGASSGEAVPGGGPETG